jgi:pyrroline-5-carboxylate reductase
VLPELAAELSHAPLVISIAAGVPLSAIEARLSSGTDTARAIRVVRAMPNTPALVGAGATAIAGGQYATSADLEVAEAIFRSVGIVTRVEESLMNAVTGLSGSGPAYVFLMVEALTEAGVRAGLSAETAAALSAQTVYGAGKLLHESSDSPATLRRNVTSPGGTTQAGVEQLESRGLREVIAQAVLAATAIGAELGEEAAKKLKA